MLMNYKTEKKMDDKYSSQEIENRCMKFWEESQVYKYDPEASRNDTYSIDTPPPTISGSLHIGHIFGYTQTDVMARFYRMQGKSVFYPIGWDDNGLPTERRVQNYYNINCNPNVPYEDGFKPVHDENDKSPRKDVSRKNFIEACEVLIHQDEKIFENIFRRIGHSYDWSLKYSTISKKSIEISQRSFLDMVKKGKAQSVEAPTMWDVTFQSAIAQAEVEDKELEGHFHNIKFGIEGENASFTIATTRPELLPACIAVVAHPEDERYQKFFGKNAIVPLFDAPVPIVASEHAEKDKGTGIMMVCTFGDAADVAWWKQSGMAIKQIIGLDGRIMDIEYGKGVFVTISPEKANANFKKLVRLTVKKAKEQIVQMLREDGSLIGEPEKIMHPVKFYEKGSLPLEFVTSRQWFVNLLGEKKAMLEAGNKIKWQPAYMQSRYDNWTENLNQEWCISRQRFFGVPFPVWYKIDDKGIVDYNSPIFADEKTLPVDPMVDVPAGYTEAQRGIAGGFTGDKDIMDTWATSALTPQIAMAHAPKGNHLSMPFDVRPQGHDIIRTWAFYTIAKSLIHEGNVPWNETFINGFILDPDRKKMSKSKGNVVTPMDLLEKHSSDAVRYWATRAKRGLDIAFEEQIMDQGRKLAMKIFNASKFVFTIVSGSSVDVKSDYIKNITNITDKSWLSRLSEVVNQSTKNLLDGEYHLALETTEKCFWDFCDNYLEIVKTRAYDVNDKSAVSSLMLTLDTFIKLFAPFCPFIAEEIFQSRSWQNEGEVSVHTQKWPSLENFAAVKTDDAVLYDALVQISTEIRKVKTAAGKTLKTPVSELEMKVPDDLMPLLKQVEVDIKNVGRVVDNGIFYRIGEEELVIKNIALSEEVAQ